MRLPLTPELVRQASEYSLRSGCRDCFFWSERRGECWHGWPDDGQRSWPPPPGGETAPGLAEAVFCKEFELR